MKGQIYETFSKHEQGKHFKGLWDLHNNKILGIV